MLVYAVFPSQPHIEAGKVVRTSSVAIRCKNLSKKMNVGTYKRDNPLGPVMLNDKRRRCSDDMSRTWHANSHAH